MMSGSRLGMTHIGMEQHVRNRMKGCGVGMAIVAAGLMLVSSVTTVQGQTLSGLEVTGYVGALLPLAPLADQGDSLKAELSTKPVFGASLDYWLGGGWGVGVTGGISQPALTVSTVDPGTGFPVREDIGSVDYVHAEATIQYRPNLPGAASVMLPYVGVGAGIRNLSFPTGSGIEDVDDIVLIINAGGQIRLGERSHLRIDLRDLISSFDVAAFDDSRRQHEVLLNVGVGIGL